MALRLALHRTSRDAGNLSRAGMHHSTSQAQQARLTTTLHILHHPRRLSTTAPSRNYSYGYAQPAPEPSRPSRSTTFFRILNSLTGLAGLYLLYTGVDALEVLAGTLMQMEANHARDHFDAQLERLRSGDMTPRDREYERRLLRWRQASREDMVDLDEHLR